MKSLFENINTALDPTWLNALRASRSPLTVTLTGLSNTMVRILCLVVFAAVTLSTPVHGQSFYESIGDGGSIEVGQGWTIVIDGAAPNTEIVACSTNPLASGCSNFAMTDSGGYWMDSGNIPSSAVGNWYETWSVAGVEIGAFSFTVYPTCTISGSSDAYSIYSYDYWSGSPGYGGVYEFTDYGENVHPTASISSSCHFTSIVGGYNGRLEIVEDTLTDSSATAVGGDIGYSGGGMSQEGNYSATVTFYAMDYFTNDQVSAPVTIYLDVYDEF